MDDILKVAAVAVTASLCACVVGKQVKELGLVLALAAGVLILGSAFQTAGAVRTFLEDLANTAGLAPAILAPVLKTVGISVVTRVSAALCRDAGEGGIAAFVETAGAILALYVSLPPLQGVLDALTEQMI